MEDVTNIGNLTDFANELLKANICAIPCKMPDKRPALPEWTKFQKQLPAIGQHQFNGALGIITGKISGNVFVLDLDIKYDVTGTLLDRLQEEIGDELWDRIFQSAYIQRTVNNGLHIFLRCEQIEGNLKLARRYATDDEKTINPDEKVKVLLETRGEGGFIVVAPTPGYEVITGSLQEIGFVSIEDKERLFECCRFFNEVYSDVQPPTSKRFISTISGDVPPWEDYNQRADVPDYLQSQGWTYFKTVGKYMHFARPGKKGATSGTYSEETNLFRCFSTSTPLESDKSYSPTALFTFLECNGNFEESAKRLREKGFGSSQHIPPKKPVIPQANNGGNAPQESTAKYFKDYIIKEEPTEEKGIISISGVNVLSVGNVLLLTGPMKGRKTMLASILVNQCKLKTAYVDSEQGKKHSWRTGKYTPSADVFHMRGEDPKEIMRVINCCVESGEYQLMVLDNVRDLLSDFNNVEQSGELELFLKKVSESVPVIAILHENKNSTKGQGHLGHGAAKIAQTTIRVQLVDVEDPGKGSFVECVHSRDEPFKRAFISKDGVLSNDDLIKTGGKTMLFDDFIQMIGNDEFSQNALLEKIAEIFDIKESSARNSFREIRKAWPNAFSERKEGKKKFFRYCIDFKMHNNAAMH